MTSNHKSSLKAYGPDEQKINKIKIRVSSKKIWTVREFLPYISAANCPRVANLVRYENIEPYLGGIFGAKSRSLQIEVAEVWAILWAHRYFVTIYLSFLIFSLKLHSL